MNNNHPLDFQQDRELIVELLASLENGSDAYRFARLVQAGIDSFNYEQWSEADLENLKSSIGDLRQWIESDQSNPPDSLQQVEQWWGHLIEANEDVLDVDCGWGIQEATLDELVHDPMSDDVAAPSAEQIQSLMENLRAAEPQLPNEEPSVSPPDFQTSHRVSGPTSISDAVRREYQPSPTKTGNHPLDLAELNTALAALDNELREALVEDTVECVGAMEAALLKLEADPQDQDSIQKILRELHTLKGASASVGLTVLADRLHSLEDQLREDQTANRRPDINKLLQSVDVLSRAMAGETNCNDLPVGQASDSPGIPPKSLPSFAEGPADDETVRVKASKLNRLMDMLAELVMLRNRRDTELEALQEVYHELIGSVSKMRLLSNEERSSPHLNSSIQISEVANDVMEVAQDVKNCARPVAEGNAAVSQFIRQFRQELVELRRTPISGLFQRLQRSVRDAAKAESKRVELRLVGEQSGIERTLQQRLYEPLLHIVRNSVCHGIETAEQRQQTGKSETGVITIEAQSGPDVLVIEVRDDGRGLDYDAIRRRGIERGLLSPNHAASEDELAQLIFQPGFSTRQSTNQVAGRGVGMDVVAATLQRMRGWLEVDSVPGQGTKIRLSFPLPSLVQHAMVFRSGGQLFALPMQSVFSAGKLDPDSLRLRMRDFAGGTDAESTEVSEDQTGIVLAYQTAGVDGPKRVTLVVDEIVGPEEVVVRPLPALLKQHPFCSGATLSGLAQTVLLLDARRMIDANQHLVSAWDQLAEPLETEEPGTRLSVLVADDSVSARRRVVRSLSRYDVDIVEVADGKQALQQIKTQNFATVFSDLEMPHLSGLELLAALSHQIEKPVPPVVIISSRTEREFTDSASGLGAADYLAKPLTDEALDQTILRLGIFETLQTRHQPLLQTSGVTG
jgi:chemotaxis protein histidine kinase CheA